VFVEKLNIFYVYVTLQLLLITLISRKRLQSDETNIFFCVSNTAALAINIDKQETTAKRSNKTTTLEE
jgi:hypothetical protein